MPSPADSATRLEWMVEELEGIGGGRSLGFGPNRVRSFPDALAKVLIEYIAPDSGLVEGIVEGIVEGLEKDISVIGDLCPECGEAAFVRAEGCVKCLICGHSEC